MKIATFFKQGTVAALTVALLTTPILAQFIPAETSASDYGLVDDILLADPSRGLQTGTPWTNGVIPYTFAVNIDFTQRQQMLDAMRQFEYEGDIFFIPRTNEADYLRIRIGTDPNTCGSSYIGMVGGAQILTVACWTNQVLLHELGHALGLYHEHQRSDRDSFITIDYDNIPPERWHNFDIFQGGVLHTDYDFLSVMHYHQYAAAIDVSQPTIIAKPGYQQHQNVMGTVTRLSSRDADAIRQIYGASDWGPVLSSPLYLLFETIEGQAIAAPQSIQVWNNGLGPIPYYLDGVAATWVIAIPDTGLAHTVPTTHQFYVDTFSRDVGTHVNFITVRRSLGDWGASSLVIELRVYLHIPDASFKAYLVAQFDSDQDGEISKNEALAVTAIDCGGLGITDLTGLERFENLTFLDASDNFITDMQPIWDNPNLTQDPDCSHYIDISENALNTNPGQGYCWLHCFPIGFVNTADQSGAANPILCRCEEQNCDDSP